METTTAPPTPAKKRGKAKAKDPNRIRVPVKRAEIYIVVRQLEQAKARKVALTKRLTAFAAIQEDIKLVDTQIANLSKRVTALMGETAQVEEKERTT